MKNLNLKISLVLMLFTFGTIYATAKNILPSYQIKVVESNAFEVRFDHPQSDLSIKVIDASGNLLTTKYINKKEGTYYAKFILSPYKQEIYQLVIEDELRITTTSLTKTDKWIELDEDKTIVYKPYIKLVNQYVDVNLLNLKQGEITVSLFDKNNYLIFEQSFEDLASFNKRFDLSILADASYLLKLRVDDHTYYKNISMIEVLENI